MIVSKPLLESMAGAIAIAAGLPSEAVAIWQNDDGSFEAKVCGATFSASSLAEVLTWAAREARAAVERGADLESSADRRDDYLSP